jgi:hypothetical protein
MIDMADYTPEERVRMAWNVYDQAFREEFNRAAEQLISEWKENSEEDIIPTLEDLQKDDGWWDDVDNRMDMSFVEIIEETYDVRIEHDDISYTVSVIIDNREYWTPDGHNVFSESME